MTELLASLSMKISQVTEGDPRPGHAARYPYSCAAITACLFDPKPLHRNATNLHNPIVDPCRAPREAVAVSCGATRVAELAGFPPHDGFTALDRAVTVYIDMMSRIGCLRRNICRGCNCLRTDESVN